ncbi:signal transduction histidine kinase [Desulfosalsimonas propionicica]|uniref:histidine kinase n=1 Tax=Desulfosalsimonas propionicica TaxID=332175 RepID=A0A7W0CCB0_9BACT|nr:ATP-binding protein [Desulfosalsimonas propionicica]MBA2883044.1 signal transduction histidine kinase [Desulfosalsimonas propionicica]
MIVPDVPIRLVDMIGSALMIVFSFLCVRRAVRLRRSQADNVVWTYMLWLCCCLAGFAVSRSGGHILKQFFSLAGRPDLWDGLRPFAGGINTFLLIIVAAATLFFNRVWHVYQQITMDRRALQDTHQELLALNQDLEKRIQDRTDALIHQEKQMAHADRLASIGKLSSGIAHEINNPLGVIQGYTQLLLRGESEDSQRRKDLQVILKHAQSCKSIVEDLLNFARRSQPEMADLNIHEVIEETLVFVQHRSKMENIRIYKEFSQNMPNIRMDEKKIKQVLVNLLMNAAHAVEQDGTITIATRFDESNRRLEIDIADNGYGIEEKNLTRIFDPFFTTKSTGEGTGLGLAVSYGIAKSHGGDIRVQSRVGKGSVFTLLLPVSDSEGGGANG